ncbi:type II toxin-antitoxin system tRNA(fMet)-specific endonuclease VapC [Methylophilus aquaticus]|uniref:Ribonuclease VapC n=1 Tax=Methylophilus aquaticus TaxID=1971610 RepID=A0ABT9JVY6_9PROT|nr:type II toxin-antitoxin system VapC family toxin [Methylophilus aquaticus]MDP8568756.1 type II toxin-antitoxin system VapC family toxin [Methylophilus aquaticus]
MKLMLDTNICIAIIKQKPPAVLQQFAAYQIGDIGVSSVTLAELRYGVAKSQQREANQAALDAFVLPLDVADFDEAATQYYGALRASLEKQGTPIGPLDTMIAAHALSLDVTLVTNNTKEFARVDGLKLLDWFHA